MLSLIGAICLFLVVGLGNSRQVLTTVNLDYGTFQGAYDPGYNISYWQKIPFAAPPTGQNRFRAPQPPLPIPHDVVYDSSQPFDMCPQRTVNGSEDCLYLGLYGRPWTPGAALRPVVVTFYGGGFIQGSASFNLPPSAYPILNVSAATDLIFVYPNYRVNAFGFLPGREVAEDRFSDANAGLLDQAMALRWTRRYIGEFGGDKDRVTIWGQSAGGGSVLAQTIADHGFSGKARSRNQYRNRNRNQKRSGKGKRKGIKREKEDGPLFRQALASSPFWPKTYAVDAPEAQWRYDALANLTGCAVQPDSLKCLKSVDVQTIRDANLAIIDSHKYTTATYEWGPVIDGVFLRHRLSSSSPSSPQRGAIVAGYGMYNTHEGETFLPPGLKSSSNTGTPPFNSSTASFDNWVSGYLPTLSRADIADLKALYPESGSAENIAGYADSFTRAGLVYRDSTLACPAYWMAGGARDGGWVGEYTIPPAMHASDVYWWNSIGPAQVQDPLHYKGYAGAMASFFMTGDPNALKLTGEDVPGLPDLRTGREWVIDSAGFMSAKLVEFKERCAFWKRVGPKIPI
ncbi:carboxylesterase [Nemania sp. FL0916]|nr:carboxylesterase [Nemania sp. FL0916]